MMKICFYVNAFLVLLCLLRQFRHLGLAVLSLFPQPVAIIRCLEHSKHFIRQACRVNMFGFNDSSKPFSKNHD